MRPVVAEGHIAQQRHPVVFRNLCRFFLACEGRRRWLHQRVRVGAFHVKSHSGLWIGQLAVPAKRDLIKVCRFLAVKRSEEHTSELQSRPHLVCRLLLEKKNNWPDSFSRIRSLAGVCFFFFNDTATTEIYTLSLHDALPILLAKAGAGGCTNACESGPSMSKATPACGLVSLRFPPSGI